ncbi:hypothetical protein T08_649 [Trichinella sp. T8]|nr:hypothetical protein T08_649 [Trichinella sp. T8]
MPLENFWVKLQAEYPKNNCRTFIKGEERVLTQVEKHWNRRSWNSTISGYVLPEKVLVPFVSRKLEVLPQHSRFFKQIIQYSDMTPEGYIKFR